MSPTLQELLYKAKEVIEAMTPEERAAHFEEQRQSWGRAEMQLSKLERDTTTFIRDIFTPPQDATRPYVESDIVVEILRWLASEEHGITWLSLEKHLMSRNIKAPDWLNDLIMQGSRNFIRFHIIAQVIYKLQNDDTEMVITC